MSGTGRGAEIEKPSRRWAALMSDRRMVSISTDLPTEADISRVQDMFASPLPAAWVSWVRECGSVIGYGRVLLGLRPRRHGDIGADIEDALDVLLLLRLTEPNFAHDLLPIEVLPERQLHCVVVGAGSRVVLIDLDRPDLRVDAAPDLGAFVYEWRADLYAMSAVVDEVVAAPVNGEIRLLRPDEWSTRRLCSQNVIVALLQTRHNRDSNEHDVAIFAIAGLSAFAGGAPTRWALTTVLTEAHQAGGSLAINFVRRSRKNGVPHPHRVQPVGQRIPPSIVRWATTHGLQLDGRETRWDHATGEALFVAATRLPDSLRTLLPKIEIAPATVCAAITTGTWPALDVEIVLRWAEAPERILRGEVEPADRLRFLADQQVVRSALMLSSLLRHLQRQGQASASDEDDTTREIMVSVATEPPPAADRTLSAVTFASIDEEPLHVGWRALAGPQPVAPRLAVRVLAVDIDLLAQLGPLLVGRLSPSEVLLVPADAAARQHRIGPFLAAADAAGVTILAAPDYTTSMDVAIAKRLDRSRMSRQ
jgi:hypothetical protein